MPGRYLDIPSSSPSVNSPPNGSSSPLVIASVKLLAFILTANGIFVIGAILTIPVSIPPQVSEVSHVPSNAACILLI